MKQFFHDNRYILFFVFSLIIIWRLFPLIPLWLGEYFLSLRTGFIGTIPWGNFDGVHYLSIAQNGYFQYEQAFFPLFPLLIKYISIGTLQNYTLAAVIITYVSLFFGLFLLYKLVRLDFSDSVSKWVLVFLLFFPVGFFFGALYTESFFLTLVVGSFYAARRKKWILAGFLVGLASATKLVGIFLLPALIVEWYLMYRKSGMSKNIQSLISLFVLGCIGLGSYCFYLWKTYGDPILFIHAQPAFGANRSGGELIFLPQVLYRYIKIFFTVSFSNYDAWIALLEFSMLGSVLILLVYGFWKQKMRPSYLLFSLLVIIGPTLTGSLSSIPRYILVAFPVFLVLGLIKNIKIKLIILCLFASLLIVLCAYFLRGYFVS